ncbi:amphi-Trp domain-containing protein [Halegenticoccus soli]|uniref:amphi-Trp domain-containing protein n=1 Tax=Halegenticoccus soli TaxID=1985678 RepID=UPI000C6E5FE0|nr:amphi-Trp domain-containing protein [Halegenticoccus soli]
MGDETIFEFERPIRRAATAALFRELADGLARGGAITFTAGEAAATVTPPDQLLVEFEIEREEPDEGESEDGSELSLEVELEWSVSDESDESDGGDEARQGKSPDDRELSGSVALDRLDDEEAGSFEIYEDRAGEWRWRLVDGSDDIIAMSGRGFPSRRAAADGVRRVIDRAAGAGVGGPEPR